MTSRAANRPYSAVLFDRDGTLIVDVPDNMDRALVKPMPNARVALDRLRAARVPTAVVTNQSAIGLGRISRSAAEVVNARTEELLGPLGPVFMCEHAPGDGCGCRKPLPGLIVAAAHALGVSPDTCVVVGDIGSDMDAAAAAGARSILVPTAVTRPGEIAAAACVAGDLDEAVSIILRGRP